MMIKVTSYVVVGMVGVLIGGVAVAGLSARASSLYGQMLRLAFSGEEEARLRSAWQTQDLVAAARHASCGVDVLSARAFSPERSLWDVSFPLMGVFAGRNARYPVDEMTMSEGYARARLGIILERMGDKGMAEKYFADAASLTGLSVAEVKQAGQTTLGAPGSPDPE